MAVSIGVKIGVQGVWIDIVLFHLLIKVLDVNSGVPGGVADISNSGP